MDTSFFGRLGIGKDFSVGSFDYSIAIATKVILITFALKTVLNLPHLGFLSAIPRTPKPKVPRNVNPHQYPRSSIPQFFGSEHHYEQNQRG